MVTIFTFTSYLAYLQERIRILPKGGRGALGKIAQAAWIHASVLSQIFQGQRHLTHEQAAAVADYLELSNAEAHFFLLLVQYERAGTNRLRELIQIQLDELRVKEAQLSRRLPIGKVLTDEERALFYSNWYYSAVRVLCSIATFQSIEALSQHLRLPRSKISEVVQFLLDHGLCVEKNGKIHPGPQSTHLEADSPLVSRHHSNWRIKAMEKHPALDVNRELSYSSPMSLSVQDVAKVREKLVAAIQEVCKIVDPSPSEVAFCLNIDWFQF